MTLLALVDDLGVRRDRASPRLEPGEARQLVQHSAHLVHHLGEPLGRAQEMFDELTRPGTEQLKVLLKP